MGCAASAVPVLVGAKILAHWILSSLPLAMLAPVLALQFDLDAGAMQVLVLSLLVGTPLLSLIGAVGAALTLGVRGGEVLLSLLILPLYIPALVFGAGAVEAQISGVGYAAHMSSLMAMLVLAALLCAWTCSAALRISLEYLNLKKSTFFHWSSHQLYSLLAGQSWTPVGSLDGCAGVRGL